MKRTVLLLFVIPLFFLNVSCSKDESKNGTVTFGANYNVINCITNVTIFVDGEKIGKLESYTAEITDCGQPGNVTKKLPVGEHTYKVEIRPEAGSVCAKDINGTFLIRENECTKVFVDYDKIKF